MKIIGVDIGGTHIDVALIEDKKIIKSCSCRTPSTENKETVTSAVEQAIQKLFADDVAGIGVGVPGLVDLETNDVLDVYNIPSWDRVPLKAILEKRFQKPVFVNNDANCFAIGEKYFGKGRNYKNFVGITFGTGVGTGIVIDDKLYSGRFCGAGEFGTIYYLDKSVEAYSSGQFFKDQNLDGKILAEKATAGDEESIQLFYEFGKHIGRAIANVLFALAPEAVIFGGSVSRSYQLFEPGLRWVMENEFPYQRLWKALKIEISDLENSAVLGASSLVLEVLEA